MAVDVFAVLNISSGGEDDGSMERAKHALEAVARKLDEDDRFSLVVSLEGKARPEIISLQAMSSENRRTTLDEIQKIPSKRELDECDENLSTEALAVVSGQVSSRSHTHTHIN